MPERSSKRKARRDSVTSSLGEPEATSLRTENVPSISDQDFSELSEKIEKSVTRRIRDAEVGQREILKMIENLSSRIDSLSGQPPNCENLALDSDETENQASTSRPSILNELHPSQGQHMVTGVFPQAEVPPRSSSLPPPNQKYPDHIVEKLLESLQNVTQQNIGLPRLPKAMSTTMPTFKGKNDKFEHFEDLFMTSLKVYPNISEEEKIHYFHSLLRDDALQTYRNMTDTNRASLEDIIATFRRRYVCPQSIATARCKWNQLYFDPSQQTFQDFLEQYQKLAQEAYGDDAPKFIETSFYAKMPTHLKRVLNQARLETESYEMMVEHLEREMELNGLLAPNESNITGVHQIDVQDPQQAPNPPKPSGPCYGCGQSGHVVKNCRKVAREARNRGNRVPNKIVNPCETCGKKSHTTEECYSGANWANRPQWWKTPKATSSNSIPLPPQSQGQYAKTNLPVTQPPYQNQTTSQIGYLPPLSMTTQPQTQTQYHNQTTGHMGFIPPAQVTTQPQTQPQNQTQSKN